MSRIQVLLLAHSCDLFCPQWKTQRASEEVQAIAQYSQHGMFPMNDIVCRSLSRLVDPKELELEVDPHAVQILEGEDATSENVFQALPSANIVHIACPSTHGVHGRWRPEPLGDAIYLEGKATVTVQDLLRLDTLHAEFVFLNLFSSSSYHAKTRQDQLGMAACLLHMGVGNVVAAMWYVSMQGALRGLLTGFRQRDKRGGKNDDGQFIATEFYRYLGEKAIEGVDLEYVPYALDHAIRSLRAKGVSPARWMPFVHVGG